MLDTDPTRLEVEGSESGDAGEVGEESLEHEGVAFTSGVRCRG